MNIVFGPQTILKVISFLRFLEIYYKFFLKCCLIKKFFLFVVLYDFCDLGAQRWFWEIELMFPVSIRTVFWRSIGVLQSFSRVNFDLKLLKKLNWCEIHQNFLTSEIISTAKFFITTKNENWCSSRTRNLQMIL